MIWKVKIYSSMSKETGGTVTDEEFGIHSYEDIHRVKRAKWFLLGTEPSTVYVGIDPVHPKVCNCGGNPRHDFR